MALKALNNMGRASGLSVRLAPFSYKPCYTWTFFRSILLKRGLFSVHSSRALDVRRVSGGRGRVRTAGGRDQRAHRHQVQDVETKRRPYQFLTSAT